MIKTFHLPDLGEGLAEAEIIRWMVAIGDPVKADQPMLEVENAKAVMQVPAPFSGKIIKFYAKPGDIVETHKPLVDIEVEEDAATEPPKKDAGSVVGTVVEGHEIMEEKVVSIGRATSQAANVKATPAVRAMAKRLGIDLNLIKPTGPGGQIIAQDVEQFTQKGVGPVGAGVPLKGSRRTMSKAMSQAHLEVVPASLTEDADIEAWQKDSVPMLRLIRALIAGCKAEPALNAWYDGKSMSRQIFQKIDLGIAMDLGEEGLFVPVLRDVSRLKGEELQSAYVQLKERMKARTLPPEDLRGNTITLSNFGSIAGRYASPVVLLPTVAIVAAGRIRGEVVAKDSQAVVHRVLPLSITFDHRAVTGGETARFLAAMVLDLEKPT